MYLSMYLSKNLDKVIVYVNIKRCSHFRPVTRRDASTRKPPPPCPPWPPPGAGPGRARQQPPSPCSLLRHQPRPRQEAELRAPRAPAREQRALDPGVHREVPRTLGGQEKQTNVPVQEEGNVGEWASIRYTRSSQLYSFLFLTNFYYPVRKFCQEILVRNGRRETCSVRQIDQPPF